MKKLLAALILCASLAFTQGISRIDGTVTDPSGAAVPGAEITVTSSASGQTFKTTSDEKGQWSILQLDAGIFRVSVAKPGFKVASAANVQVTAGEPTSVPIKLEVGQATETVTVQSGAEVVQAASAEITNTLTGRQVTELPFATRNAVELMVTQPGTATPTNPRSSTINGLPKGAINITIDGINTQDNELKSSDGFFSYIMPSVDSLEEVTLTTSAAGADSTAQGAAQIKFVTKSGTNQFHGGAFYQARNTFFNSNYFFNNQNHLPRDILHLRQYGGHLGGPIIKDKLFFFGNYERFRNPASNAFSQSIGYPTYAQGLYNYADTAGNIHQANLFAIAGSGNSALPSGTRQFPTTIDPIVAQTYAQVAQLTSGVTLVPNSGSGDYNSGTYNYQLSGLDSRDFWTARFDYNINAKHHLSYTYDYDKYVSVPDFLNGIVPVYPGTGAVLGTNVTTGQRSNRFVGTLALRSALSSRLTNELRAGLNGGTVLFFDAINDGLFQQWRGYSVGITYAHIATTSGPQRRNGPYKEVGDTLSWVKGAHQISAGFTWSQINLWQQIFGSESIPGLGFGVATGDPLNTGTSAPFNIATNFPSASSTQISNMAGAYAGLTGRVSSISRQIVDSETTHNYVTGQPPVDRDEEQWWGLFGQDVWRVAPTLTVTLGLRWEREGSWQNLDHLYTNVSTASIWGLSGIGNLFAPGPTPGVVPTYSQLTSDNTYHMPAVWAPSVGIAWQVPAHEGILGAIFGHHAGASVLRMGYSIATTREGSGTYQSVYAANQGITVSASISPTTYPADFGPAGSVLFRDATLPTRSGLPTTQVFPIPATFTASLNAFDPNLKMGYVQSWNIGFQREISRNTVVEVRYTGNHGLHEWRQLNLNEVNTIENGFQSVFAAARNNLTIARGGNINNTAGGNNYGNQGLAGQTPIPFLQSALGTTCCTDSSTAQQLTLGQIGSLANGIATNATRYANMTAAGYPANYFVVNPTVAGGGTFDVLPWGSSYYDSGQVELRRRLAAGMQFQMNYSFSKSLADGATASSSTFSQPTTLRDLRMDKVPDGFDIRQAIKANYIYELPFGPGRHFLSGTSNKVLKKAIEGWEVAGVARVQSGTPLFWSGFGTVNPNSSGVVLHNITTSQLQSMVNLTKGQNPVSGAPAVYYLPPPVSPSGLTSSNNTNFITNTQAAFNVNNLTPAQVDPSAPYIGPAGAGQWACRCYIYLPWQRHFDVSLIKVTHIRESVTLEFRAQALNVFNITNFLPGQGNTSSTFGTVTSAYRDISGTYDPGGRILEFVGRINF
jgi:Carboxypeptidase regulatory-like domain